MANPFLRVAAEMDRPRRRANGTAWAGGAMNRLTADFNPFVQSPTQETQWALPFLRARAQYLVRNNSHAAGFVTELANQVIGSDGILLQAKIKTADRGLQKGELHTTTNNRIEAGWLEWGMPENATVDGYESWVDFQRTLIKTLAVDGEFFIRKYKGFDNAFGYSLQLIDAELVDVSYNVPASAGQNQIRLGIEVNQYGRPVAYHIWNCFAGEMNGLPRERKRVSAEQIIHKFVRYRANQVRGVTWFAPVLLNLKNIDGYEFNELAASRANAAKMGFITNKSAEAIAAFDWNAKKGAPTTMDVEPLLIQELLPGQEFAEFNPTHPSTAYKDFMKAVLRSVARGLGMAYTTLTGDLEAVNYSSIRAGLLSERDGFRYLQRFLGIHVHRAVYREWVSMALLSGQLVLDSRISSDYFAVEWRPRGWKWVDPVNDLTAAALAISLGLDSRQRLAAEQGRDFEEIVLEIQHELEFADAMGVNVEGTIATAAKKAIPAQGGDQPNPDGENVDAPDTSNPTDDSGSAPAPDDAGSIDASELDRRRNIRALKAALRILERKAA
jgi:lambda family phage portal protein